jgi:hypothetical protein
MSNSKERENMKIQIKYTIESIYDLPGEQNYQTRIFICEVASMYEWRNLLYLAVSLRQDEELFVNEIKELK